MLTSHWTTLGLDREPADNYIAHTHIGDPVMDEVVEDLASLPQRRVHELIHAGMEEDRPGLRNAPQSLRDFFFDAPQPDPDWLDRDAFQPGILSFQRNSVLVLSAFVAGVLVDGFSTLISKSFVQTGRIFDNGVWRLKQNNRHQVEIFLPGGLERHGEGWKLSVRIRFVHAQGRRLLGQTEEWEHDVWRYAGYLMGIPETILFTDEEHALHLYRIGSVCEPLRPMTRSS